MIAEHDVGPAEHGEEPAELRLATRMGDEIARDEDQIWVARRNPGNRVPGCEPSARQRRAQVEVREVCEAEAVERRRQPVDLRFEHTAPQPAGLEPRVDDEPERRCDETCDKPINPGHRETP